MNRFTFLLTVLLIVGLNATVLAGVTVTPASGGVISGTNAANGISPAWTTLGDIVITEGFADDFIKVGSGSPKTLILTAPTNWHFNPGIGTFTATTGGDVSLPLPPSPSITVTDTKITLAYICGSKSHKDVLTIGGIQVQEIDGRLTSPGNILRTIADSGTSTIVGVVAGVTNFGSLVGNGILPVEMTSFTAVLQGTNALLKWTTATEVNNSGFEIQRRIEGSSMWTKIGFVTGSGTSNSSKEYTYQDVNLASGTYVYRIKQIDNDGVYKYSASTQVNVGISNTFQLSGNYPNPFNPTTNMQFSVPEDGYASLKVYNILGQEVATLFAGMAKTGHYIPATFNASKLSSGVYFARLQYSDKNLVQKMLMTK